MSQFPVLPRRAVRRARFSIVELIVVMVVLLVMLGISLGTIRAVSSANLVDATAREVGGELHIARQLAIARRRYVACIMPGTESGLKPGQMCQVYRLAYVTRASTDCDFEAWVDGSNWRYTHPNVSIMEADNDVGIRDTGGYVRDPKDNSSTRVDDVNMSSVLGGGGSVANVRAVVFAPNGRLFGSSRYVTVGRATYDGSRWNIDAVAAHDKNISCSDQLTLEINRFTGGISYLEVEQY